jgi:hypothetical protein
MGGAVGMLETIGYPIFLILFTLGMIGYCTQEVVESRLWMLIWEMFFGDG